MVSLEAGYRAAESKYSRERQVMTFFDKKKTKKFYDAKWIF